MRTFFSRRRAVVPAVRPTPNSVALADALERFRLVTDPILNTDAPELRRYLVTYDRAGRHGRRGTPAPAPLTLMARTAVQLAESIAADAEEYVGAAVVVTVDMTVMGGQLTAGGLCAGTFGLEILPGGETR